MEKKRTVIGIIPSKTNVTNISKVLSELEHSFGKFNCEIDDDYAIIKINYPIPETQVQETLAICKEHCCLPYIVIGSENSEHIKPDYIEIP